MAFQTKITIDGTDVTNYVMNYKVIDTNTDTTPAYINFQTSILNIVDVTKDQEVIITRGTITATDNTIFKGNVSNVGKDGLSVSVECLDKLWIINRQTITISYDKNIDEEAGVISAIASDLITRAGFTPSVENTGTLITLDKLIIKSNSILKELQELAKLVDYWLYYDPDNDVVVFKSKGFEEFSIDLEVGKNLLVVPKWEYDYTRIINDVTLTGDTQEIETDETFASGVTTKVLTNIPESIKIFIDNSVLSGGVIGQDSSYDYSVEKDIKTITFTSATSGSGTVSYSFLRPIKVRRRNQTSIDLYGTYSVPKHIDTVKTTTDAENKINELLSKFGSPLIKTTNLGVYNVFGGHAGLKTNIIDSINNETKSVNIYRYVYNYPEIIDEIEVDDEPLYEDYILINELQKRVNRLERKNTSDGNLIIQIFDYVRTFKSRFRFLKIFNRHLTGWTWGDLRTFTTLVSDGEVYGDDDVQFDPETTYQISHGQSTYYEDFRDTEFEDSTDTTISVTNNPATTNISFSSGSIWTSGTLEKGTLYTSCRLDTGSVSGSLKYELTTDNKANYQTLSSGAVVGLTNSGTLGAFLRITENGSSTAQISNIIDSSDEVTSPAIKLQFI